MRHRCRKILLAAAALCTLVGGAVSQARDHGQYSHVPQDIRAWIEKLTDGRGIPCCATAEGTAPDEFTWDIGANHYRVKIDGQWLVVPDEAVVKGSNRIGHAIVWVDYSEAVDRIGPIISVRCFLPGPAS